MTLPASCGAALFGVAVVLLLARLSRAMETYAEFLEQGPDLPYPQWVDDEGNLRIFAIGDNEDFFGKDALRVMTLQVA